jgi:hypothetical protein
VPGGGSVFAVRLRPASAGAAGGGRG